MFSCVVRVYRTTCSKQTLSMKFVSQSQALGFDFMTDFFFFWITDNLHVNLCLPIQEYFYGLLQSCGSLYFQILKK
jgi:hypothetical protein